MSTPVPNASYIAAREAAEDAALRSASGDFTVTEPELSAYGELLQDLKIAGIASPFLAITNHLQPRPGEDLASVVNFPGS